MRRRGGEFDAGRFPQHLVVFDEVFATERDWSAAFDDWCDLREVWEAAHPGVLLPEGDVGDCPPTEEMLMHGGLWERCADGEGRCAEHGLTPDEHCGSFNRVTSRTLPGTLSVAADRGYAVFADMPVVGGRCGPLSRSGMFGSRCAASGLIGMASTPTIIDMVGRRRLIPTLF